MPNFLLPREPSHSGGLVAEQRLWLAIVLLGVADNDRHWLESPEFRLCCENAGLDPFVASVTRSDRARRALHFILAGLPMSQIYSALGGSLGAAWKK
jgi:hypothetical protein